MLIWLASYPRSGNSLLRQVLWYTMGLRTYHESARSEIAAEYGISVTDAFGGVDQLRVAAADDEDSYLVKTHLPPGDDAPAIYVVRDGRSAITSFLTYERTFSPESDPTLLRLILGDHYYGGWSDHFRAWHNREAGDTLTLRYEELFDADDTVLRRIAGFLGFEGTIEPWKNPIAYWRERAPDVVGQGSIRWEPTEEWDPVADAAFWHAHGELMRELGYDDGRRLEDVAPNVRDLVEVAASAVAARRRSEMAAVETNRFLDEAVRERELQTQVAADRLRTIEGLKREVDELATVAAERLFAIDAGEKERRALAEELDARADLLRKTESDRERQADVAADRLRTIEDLERERQALAEELAARATLLRTTDRERELQSRVAADRLAALEDLRKQHDELVAALEKQTAALLALEVERDLQARVAAERLEALEALEQELKVRLHALEELSAQRFFSN